MPLTGMAIGVVSVGCWGIARGRVSAARPAVFVLVVPQVRGLGPLFAVALVLTFVLAIRRHSRPQGLQR